MTPNNQFIVMTARAKMPSSCKFGRYCKVAVVETNSGATPKQIHPNHKSVRRIIWVRDRLFAGKTAQCAYQLALAEAHRIADEMQTAQDRTLSPFR